MRLVTLLYVAEGFLESVAKSSSCFTIVDFFFSISASYAVDNIGGGASVLLMACLGPNIFSML